MTRIMEKDKEKKEQKEISDPLCIGEKGRGVYEFTFRKVPSEHISLTVSCEKNHPIKMRD